jgi:hypothetical protein
VTPLRKRLTFSVHHVDDWGPNDPDGFLQIDQSHTAKALSGASSVVEDTGDSLQLKDIAGKRIRTPRQDDFDHTGAHLPATGDDDRPRTIIDDLSGDSPAPLEELMRGVMMSAAGQDDKRFLPLSELETIVTRSNIYEELRRSGLTSDLGWITDQVWFRVNSSNGKTTTRRKLFAILCLLEKAEAIEAFINEGIFDSDLPFDFEHPRAYRRSSLPIRLFEDWKSYERDAFENYQGRFLAPYFKLSNDTITKIRDYDLHRCIVLPFIEYEIKGSPYHQLITGGFSVVRRVIIHSAHHDHFHPSVSRLHIRRLNFSLTSSALI